MEFKVDNADFGNYGGATAGQIVTDRWQYPGIGYNATAGIFYVGEGNEVKELTIVPFSIRQCKEIETIDGITHRFPIKTRRDKMPTGDVTQRVQVVGLVNGDLHVFGARSWTARAAWVNPRSGPYHDERFDGGIWYRLQDYIKVVTAEKGIQTAPLCWSLKLGTGDEMKLTSAANPKQGATGVPIRVLDIKFVGPEQAAANEALYVSEALDEWVAEWNKTAVSEAAEEAVEEPVPGFVGTGDGLPF
jgi:hypothetical protein